MKKIWRVEVLGPMLFLFVSLVATASPNSGGRIFDGSNAEGALTATVVAPLISDSDFVILSKGGEPRSVNLEDLPGRTEFACELIRTMDTKRMNPGFFEDREGHTFLKPGTQLSLVAGFYIEGETLFSGATLYFKILGGRLFPGHTYDYSLKCNRYFSSENDKEAIIKFNEIIGPSLRLEDNS